MKKIKGFLLALMAAVIAFAIPFAACNVEEEPPYTPPPAITTDLVSIEINTDRVKKEYYAGENFTSQNLVVRAITKRSDEESTRSADVSLRATVNSSAFRRTRVGEYEIIVSYTLGDTTKSQTYTVTVKDVALTLNAQNVKGVNSPYLVGEELDLTGLTAQATTSEPNKDPATVDVTDDIKLDTSAFDNTKEGVYPITATYTVPDAGITRTASFDVTVMASREGLDVRLKDGVDSTINLDANNKTASIDVSNIEVRTVNDYGIINETPLTSGYTVELYKESQLIAAPASGTVYSGLASGTYQIWASMDSDKPDSDYVLTGFALIYIVEDVVDGSFQFESGTTTQNIGNDVMTSTWTYSIAYSTNPDQKVTISSDDVTVTNVNTFNTTSTGRARVEYTYTLANGAVKTQYIYVNYTVTQGDNQVLETNTFYYGLLPVKADGTSLTQEDFDANSRNAFISVVEGGLHNYRTSPQAIEIRYDALTVTFKGVGKLELYVRSTNDTNLSSIGLKDANGNYVDATWAQGVTCFTELTYDNGHIYQVQGAATSGTLITFNVTQPGTYTIFTNDLDPEGSEIYNRNTRIYGMVMTDIYEKTTTTEAVASYSDIDLYSEQVSD